MRALELWTLVLAIAATMVAVALLAFALVENEPSLISPAFGLGLVPWIGWALLRNRMINAGRKGFDAALAADFAGAEARWFKGSGLALDRAGGRLLVGDRDGVTVLPLADIASLRYVPQEVGSVSAAGASNMGVMGLILAVFAIGSATAGHVGSGLFIIPAGRKALQVFGIGKNDAEDWVAKITAVAPGISVLD
jgi:hypothetical protein